MVFLWIQLKRNLILHARGFYTNAYLMITVRGNVAGAAQRNLLRMLVRQMVPDRFALAAIVPAALDLVRRRTDAELEFRRKLAMRTGKSVEQQYSNMLIQV